MHHSIHYRAIYVDLGYHCKFRLSYAGVTRFNIMSHLLSHLLLNWDRISHHIVFTVANLGSIVSEIIIGYALAELNLIHSDRTLFRLLEIIRDFLNIRVLGRITHKIPWNLLVDYIEVKRWYFHLRTCLAVELLLPIRWSDAVFTGIVLALRAVEEKCFGLEGPGVALVAKNIRFVRS